MRAAVGLPGRGVIAVALPRPAGQPELALGLGAPMPHIEATRGALVAALGSATESLRARWTP
jgi:hypothetical protein